MKKFKLFVILGLLLLSFISEQISAEADIKNNSTAEACPKLAPFIQKFYNGFEGANSDSDYVSWLKQFTKTPIFHNFEKASFDNNECGARASAFLYATYNDINDKESAKKTYLRLYNRAKANNYLAVYFLCSDKSGRTTAKIRLNYCKKVFYSTSQNYKKFMKDNAYAYLFSIYNGSKKPIPVNELIELCTKANGYHFMSSFNKSSCFLNMYLSASILEEQGSFHQAFKLYKAYDDYNKTGLSDKNLAEMYLYGRGTKPDPKQAIVLYNKYLEKVTVDSYAWYNLGIAYSRINDKVSAFQCYQRAAKLGSVQGQYVLFLMYATGIGTIQDNIQAYAWISVVAAQGLNNISLRTLENARDGLAIRLVIQDKSGKDLRKAKDLAKTYYRKYVLRKQQ